MPAVWIRRHCLSLPHVTEEVLWGSELVFKVIGKMFAVQPLEPGRFCLSFKGSQESFAELVERPGISPAPYLARAHWVALESEDTLPRKELEQLLRAAYDLVVTKLPKKRQAELASPEKNKKQKTTLLSSVSAGRRGP